MRYALTGAALVVSACLAAPALTQPLSGAGSGMRTVTVGGVERRYEVYVPLSVRRDGPLPVVVAYHGGGGNPRSMARLSGLNAKADEAGFVVVYPFGTADRDPDRLTFNAGNVGGIAMRDNVDDVAFTRALLTDLAKVVTVDWQRVYATGMSNGAMMAYRVAAEAAELFAAIAPVGGPIGGEFCSPSRPVAVLHFHGTADALAPFGGGRGRGVPGVPADARPHFHSVEQSVQCWVRANGTAAVATVESLPDRAADGMRVTRRTWAGGRDGSEVVLIEIEGGGHTWPGMAPLTRLLGPSTKDISASDLMWAFFEKHARTQMSTPRAKATPPAPGGRVLRTPDARFAALPGYPFQPHYVQVDDGRGGTLRMHYIDEGPRGAPTVLLLHGNPTWSYLFREVIPQLNAAGYRTVALDYIGMGRSDKLADASDYSYDRHLAWLQQAFAQLDRELQLGRVTIFGHDYGVPLGIRLMAEHYPDRFDAFVASNASLPVGSHIAPTHQKWRQFVRDNPDVPVGHVIASRVTPTLSAAEIAGWNAPYPDASYKAAIRSFPEMVPDRPDRSEAVANLAAWRYLERFDKPFMTIFGQFDPVGQPSARRDFIERVPGAYGQPHPQLDTVSHYAPEDEPEAVAAALVAFLGDVYRPQHFARLASATFVRDLEGLQIEGRDAGHDRAQQAARIGGRGAVLSGPIDLDRIATLRVGFRYLPAGFAPGESVAVEFWNGAAWDQVLTLRAGLDFRNGAPDYGFVQFDVARTGSQSSAQVRLRTETQRDNAQLLVFDLALYGRADR